MRNLFAILLVLGACGGEPCDHPVDQSMTEPAADAIETQDAFWEAFHNAPFCRSRAGDRDALYARGDELGQAYVTCPSGMLIELRESGEYVERPELCSGQPELVKTVNCGDTVDLFVENTTDDYAIAVIETAPTTSEMRLDLAWSCLTHTCPSPRWERQEILLSQDYPQGDVLATTIPDYGPGTESVYSAGDPLF